MISRETKRVVCLAIFLLLFVIFGGNSVLAETNTEIDEMETEQFGTINGTVWLDDNQDGIIDLEEPTIPGIEVYLFHVSDKENFIAETITDENGMYEFNTVSNGTYYVGVNNQLIDGVEYLVPIATIQTGNDNKFDIDWESDSNFSYTELITIEEGNVITEVNAAFRLAGEILPLDATNAYVVTEGANPLGTFSDLASAVTACESISVCTITMMDDDLSLSNSPVVITSTMNIILTSNTGQTYKIVQENNNRHLEVNGSLTLENVIIQGPGNGMDGGGIKVNSGASLTMNNGLITGNKAYLGGGIQLVDGSRFIMTGGEISENSATGAGGGVYAVNNVTITMSGGTISENTADNNGGGIELNNSKFIITAGTISGNAANFGGGIYVTASAELTLGAGIITTNTASSAGGGIYVTDGSDFIMNPGGEISGNSSVYAGGGIEVSNDNSSLFSTFTMNGGTITGNQSGGGAGIYINGAEFTLEDGQIINNTSSSGNGAGVNVSYSGTFTMNGGSITGNNAVDGGGVFLDNSEFIMTAGIISGNTLTLGTGGGIDVKGSSTVSITGGEISDNTAASNGGGVNIGGSNITFTLDGGTITGNKATNGAGVFVSGGTFTFESGEISNNTSNGGNGGGVDARDSGSFIMNNGSITGNSAVDGGGVFIDGATFTMIAGTISENTVTLGTGGGIDSRGSSTLNIAGGEISRNTANTGGGGININGNVILTITGGTIESNTVNQNGGGINARGNTSIQFSTGTIQNNTATTGNGGGIYLESTTTLVMTSGSIINNTASIDGGGIYTADYSYLNPADVTKYSNISISNAVISGNASGLTQVAPSNATVFTDFNGSLLTNNQINYRNRNILIYDSNNGSGVVSAEEEYGYNDSVSLKTTTDLGFTAPSNYEFAYWSNNPGGTSAGGARYESTLSITNSIKLYAIWEPITYTVTYLSNTTDSVTNMPNPASIDYQESSSVSITSAIPQRNGYVFKSWNTQADGRGTTYVANNTFTIREDVTLYAQWEPAIYTVTYLSNTTDSVTNMPNPSSMSYQGFTSVTISNTIPQRAGYVFKGWNTQMDGKGITYFNGNTFLVQNNVMLYAQWEAEEIKPSPSNPTETPNTGVEDSYLIYGVGITIGIYLLFYKKKKVI